MSARYLLGITASETLSGDQLKVHTCSVTRTPSRSTELIGEPEVVLGEGHVTLATNKGVDMRRFPKLAAAATAVCLLLVGGCSGSSSEGDNGKVTVRISTFSEWGYEPLIQEYQDLHPEVTIEWNRFATSDEAKEQFQTALGAGSGLADVVGVEGTWMTDVIRYGDSFVDLSSPDVEGRWNDWVEKKATAPDGRLLGYATDIGPQAIAYRADLFEKAGLPSDRESVAELFGGDNATWDQFFAVGNQFAAGGTGVPFYDASAS
ncbi:ABC transporter substrate-binding protein, partial [Actinomyces urogenitalis]|uniref:ABC transporter substrate-binding protein n=1 Tax=Actinomyces urogenitalis TaxID=103621 RepID=UPI00242DAE88